MNFYFNSEGDEKMNINHHPIHALTYARTETSRERERERRVDCSLVWFYASMSKGKHPLNNFDFTYFHFFSFSFFHHLLSLFAMTCCLSPREREREREAGLLYVF